MRGVFVVSVVTLVLSFIIVCCNSEILAVYLCIGQGKAGFAGCVLVQGQLMQCHCEI